MIATCYSFNPKLWDTYIRTENHYRSYGDILAGALLLGLSVYWELEFYEPMREDEAFARAINRGGERARVIQWRKDEAREREWLKHRQLQWYLKYTYWLAHGDPPTCCVFTDIGVPNGY